MKQTILSLLTLLVAPSFAYADIVYLSPDLKYMRTYRDCDAEQRYSQHQAPVNNIAGTSMYLKNIKIHGPTIFGTYRGESVRMARRYVVSDNCGSGKVIYPVNGVDTEFTAYEIDDKAMLERERKVQPRGTPYNYTWKYFDGKQRALLIDWGTITCEDPLNDGSVLVSEPDHIYFIKEFITMSDEQRLANSGLLMDILGLKHDPASEQLAISLYGYEIDKFPETSRNNNRVREVVDSDLLQSLNSTRLLFEGVDTDLESTYECP